MDQLNKQQLAFLRQMGVLKGLTSQQLAEVSHIFTVITVKPDETFINEGEVSEDAYIVWKGKVAICKKDKVTGKEHAITFLGKKAIIGELSLLDKAPRSASVRAIRETTLLVLSGKLLQKFDDSKNRDKQLIYCKIIDNISKDLTRRVRETNDIVLDKLSTALVNARARIGLGKVIITVIIFMSIYVIAINLLQILQVEIGIATSLLLLIFSLIIIIYLREVIKSGYPASTFGFTWHNWQQAVKESLLFSFVIILLLIAIKWVLINYSPAWHGRALFEFISNKLDVITFILYLIFVPAQEIITRGALQASLEEFLISPHKTLLAIFVSNLIFSVMHFHFSSIFTVPVFILGFGWGWLFHRQRTLIGVILSHWLIGAFGFYIINLRPTGVL